MYTPPRQSPWNPAGGVFLSYTDAPPKNPVAARRWIQDAVRNGRYTATDLWGQRLKQRQLDIADVLFAIEHPHKVEPYPDMPRHGGTCWRLYGPDLEQEHESGVGIEAYLDSTYCARRLFTYSRSYYTRRSWSA